MIKNTHLLEMQKIGKIFPGVVALDSIDFGLQAGEVHVLLGENGAVEAIRAAGRTGDILVVGFDALNDARDAIKAGTMAGSVAQHPDDMGRHAVRTPRQSWMAKLWSR